MKTIFFIVLLFITHFSLAQFKSDNVEIHWGEETKEKKNSFLNSIVSTDQDGYYLGKSTYSLFNRDKTIVKYSKNLKKVKTFDLLDAMKGTDFLPFDEIEFCGNIYSIQYPKKRQDRRVFIQQIDRQSLTFSGKRKSISDGNRPEMEYDYHLSDDLTKMVLSGEHYDRDSKSIIFQIRSIDKDLNLAWEKELTYQKDGYYHKVSSAEVSNDGDVFIIIESGEEGGFFKSSSISEYEVVLIRNNGTKLNKIPINSNEKYLYDLSVTEDKDGLITCMGFYSNETNGNIDGVYFSKIDDTNKFVTESFDKMPATFFTQYLKDGKAKKTKKKLKKGSLNTKSYDMSNVIRREDGGIVFITEEKYTVTVTTTNPNTGATSSYTKYIYNDVIVVSLNPEGKIEWTEKIPKEQATAEDGGYLSSYTYAVVKDNIYILFNDDPKNLMNYKDGKIKSYSSKDKDDGLVTLVKIDGQGNQIREALLDTNYIGLAVVPKACEQVEKDELLLFFHWKKKQKLARLFFLK